MAVSLLGEATGGVFLYRLSSQPRSSTRCAAAVSTTTPSKMSLRSTTFNFRAARQFELLHPASGIVDFLDAIDQRPALERHPADILLDRRMGIDAFRRHRQLEFDRIPGIPYALDREIAVRGACLHVDRMSPDRGLGFVRPAGDAKLDSELGRRVRADLDLDRAGPRIGAGFAQEHLACRQAETVVEMPP